MGLTRFQPSRRSSGPPEVKEFDIQASATFPHGAPMQRDTVESDIEEHAGGATVTGIIGVSGFGASSGVPAAKGSTGFGTRMLVYIAQQDIEFAGTMINAGTVQTPNAGNDGTEYGMLKVVGEWYVDEADTTNVVLTITGFDANTQIVFFKFLASAIAD
ncbi:MAG: hypothetical protein V3T23_03120 [Nitrososphaerales archaeon]